MIAQPPSLLCRQEWNRLLREAHALLRRHGLDRLKEAEDVGGTRLVLTARPAPASDPSADLPQGLRRAPRSMRRVYRLLRAIRQERGDAAAVLPHDIFERWEQAYPNSPPSIHTIKGELTKLRKRQLAFPSRDRGWVLADPQGVLFSGTHADTTASVGDVAYATRVERDCRAHATGAAMKSYIWVPLTEDGLIEDALTEELVPPGELQAGRLRYETPTGRRRDLPAVRAELVRAEGKLAVAKVGRQEIRVRLLGEWHLAGECEQPSEPEVAA